MHAGTKIHSSALQSCGNLKTSLDNFTQRVSASGEAAIQDMSSKRDKAGQDFSQGDTVCKECHFACALLVVPALCFLAFLVVVVVHHNGRLLDLTVCWT